MNSINFASIINFKATKSVITLSLIARFAITVTFNELLPLKHSYYFYYYL